MRFWNYLKTDMKVNLKRSPDILLAYLLLPLLLSIFLGFSWSSAFRPEVSIEPIDIAIENQDQGNLGEAFIDVLNSQDMEEYFNVVASEEATFNLIIEPSYSSELAETNIEIRAGANASSSEQTILSSFVEEWQQMLVDQQNLGQAMSALSAQEFLQVQSELSEIAQLTMTDLVRAESYSTERSLTGSQFSSVSGTFFIGILFFGAIITATTKEELAGLRKRLAVVPLSPAENILLNIIGNMLAMVGLIVVYILVWRVIDGQTFLNNPLFYLVWGIIYSFFFSSLATLIATIFPNQIGNAIFQILNIAYVLLGMIPMERILGGAAGEFFETNFFRVIFLDPFFDYIITGNWFGNLHIAISLLSISTVVLFITIAIERRKELAYS